MGEASGARISFGTSGMRGPAEGLADGAAFGYVLAFLQMLSARGHLLLGGPVHLTSLR
jgi:hypothetical protein